MAELVAASTDHSGGLNRAVGERVSMNESSILQNLIHVGGNLTSIDGRYNTTPSGLPGSGEISSLYRFKKTGHRVDDTSATSKKGWMLASRGAYVYLACEVYCTTQEAVLGESGSYLTIRTADSGNEAGVNRWPNSANVRVTPVSGDTTPYYLQYSSKNTTNGRLTCAIPYDIPNGSLVECVDFRPILYSAGYSDPAEYASANGRCYIAFNGLSRFDGFFYSVGTVACTGNTTLTGTNTTWSGFVLPGDKVYYCNRNGATTGTWYGPYTVASVGGNTSITLTSNAFFPVDKADYIIVRTHNAGIEAPGSIATGAVSAGSSALDDSAAYLYKWVYYDVSTGKESVNASPVSTSHTTGTDEGIRVRISLTPEAPDSYYPGKGIRIYRTDGGGSTYKILVSLPFSTYKTSPIYYDDIIADASLGTAFTSRTTDATLIDAYTTPTVSALAGGSGMSAGDYLYKWTLYNSLTGTESNPSDVSATITVTSGGYVTLTMPITGCDRQADYCRVYRTFKDQIDEWYYAGEAAWTAGVTDHVHYTDTLADTSLDQSKILSNEFNAPPAYVSHARYHNGRMYVAGDTSFHHRGYFSTIGDPEHWPRYEYGGPDEPTFEDPTLGGYFSIGHSGDEILGFTPSNEGAFPSLLVQTRSKTWQWVGSSWVDHQLIEAWTDGTASARSWANYKGILFGLSADTGPQRKLPGSMPEGIYEKVFPLNRYPFRDQVTAGGSYADYFEKCVAVCWRDYYLIAFPQSTSTYNNKMYAYHIPTGTWCEIGTTDHPVNASCLSVWDGPGDNGELYYGDAVTGCVYRLFAKTGVYTLWSQDVGTQVPLATDGVNCVWRSGAIHHGKDASKEFNVKVPGRLTMNFQEPDSAQSITVKAYQRGDEATATGDGVTLSLASTASGERNYLTADPLACAPSFQIGWSGEFTKTVVQEGYTQRYKEEGTPTS